MPTTYTTGQIIQLKDRTSGDGTLEANPIKYDYPITIGDAVICTTKSLNSDGSVNNTTSTANLTSKINEIFADISNVISVGSGVVLRPLNEASATTQSEGAIAIWSGGTGTNRNKLGKASAVGNEAQPIYINSNGVPTAIPDILGDAAFLGYTTSITSTSIDSMLATGKSVYDFAKDFGKTVGATLISDATKTYYLVGVEGSTGATTKTSLQSNKVYIKNGLLYVNKTNTQTSDEVATKKDVLDAIATVNILEYKATVNGGSSIENSTLFPPAQIPANSKGLVYIVGTSGYINKKYFDKGDMLICNVATQINQATALTSDADLAAILNKFDVIQGNLDNAVTRSTESISGSYDYEVGVLTNGTVLKKIYSIGSTYLPIYIGSDGKFGTVSWGSEFTHSNGSIKINSNSINLSHLKQYESGETGDLVDYVLLKFEVRKTNITPPTYPSDIATVVS